MSDTIEVTGKIVNMTDEATFGTFTKREIWIEMVDGAYTQTIPVEFGGKALGALDGIAVGDTVTAAVNLRGRIWTPTDGRPAKCFGSLSGWRIEKVGGNAIPQQTAQPFPTEQQPAQQELGVPGSPADNIPFMRAEF
jgi:hypothetical protein